MRLSTTATFYRLAVAKVASLSKIPPARVIVSIHWPHPDLAIGVSPTDFITTRDIHFITISRFELIEAW
jgi:hypothetical protein